MRRFQSTLDGDLLSHWAHLCVCFVEVFHSGDGGAAAAIAGHAAGGGVSYYTSVHHTLTVRLYLTLYLHYTYTLPTVGRAAGGGVSEAELLAMPLPDALAALRAAQERATPISLMDAMRDLVDGATADALIADSLSGGQPL